MYKALIKPLLFLLPPERAHYFTTDLLRFLLKVPGMKSFFQSIFSVRDQRLEKELWGIEFPNPVGLAAGFDKDAKFYKEMAALGFGFVEIGTLTPKAQAGNPKPRLFRLPEDEALINRMGFNNGGVDDAVLRLKSKGNLIVGGNIGKNKVTPNEEAVNDYTYSFHALFPYVDYFVVNVSSPNTPNLRALQEKEPLKELLGILKKESQTKKEQKPILLKIAPDLSNEQLDDIIEIVVESGIEGVIATNTTISRLELNTSESKVEKIGAGGLSGKPVKSRSTEVIRYLVQKSGKAFPVIGVGGIHSAEDAIEKLNAGAELIQVYSGFIYEGPTLVKRINKAILSR